MEAMKMTTYKYTGGLPPMLLDENMEIHKFPNLPDAQKLFYVSIQHVQERLVRSLMIPESHFEAAKNASREATTLTVEAVYPAFAQVREIQKMRQNVLGKIRQWVKDARGGDPVPLDTVMEFAAQYLTPEQLTWESLNMAFISTDHAWLRLEMSMSSQAEDTAKACQCILYLMMRESDDNGSLSPDV
jgi:hypothetical protein